MTYRIEGLPPEPFRDLFDMDEAGLAARRARRVVADRDSGYPCRVSLEEAQAGETLILAHHVSHAVDTPFRTAFAIYVREQARSPAVHVDAVPALLDRRTIGLRGYDEDGMLVDAVLAPPGAADGRIRALLDRPEIASIHAHNAAQGCFLAAIGRD